MILFLVGLGLFLLTHIYSSFRSRKPESDMKIRLGIWPFRALYSLFALAGLIILCLGFAASRPSPNLYTPPIWSAHLNWLLMLIALIILTAAMVPAGYIKKTLKHPMLVAIKIWAFGHLLCNGELNSVILFGSFLAYGVLSRIAAKRRGDMGAASAVAHIKYDIVAVLVGGALYGLFVVYLHQVLIGVAVR